MLSPSSTYSRLTPHSCRFPLTSLRVAGGRGAYSTYVKRAGPPIVGPENGTGSHEDPFVWVDRRGNYHALTHNQGDGNRCGGGSAGHSCGAHLFSRDSYRWGISGKAAYSSAVRLKSNASVVNTGTRQRPQLVFSDDEARRPLYLFNGASFEGNNPDLHMLTHTLAFEFE